MSAETSRRRVVAVSALVLWLAATGIVLFWLSLSRASHTAPPVAPRSVEIEKASQLERVAALDVELAAFDNRAPSGAEPSTTTADEVEHPHPITPAHERLRRERGFIAELNQAIDFHDGEAMREALEAYRREFPEDQQRLQQGYAVIAACMTAPGDASRAAAERFYADHHGSSLRRWVRRVCLET